MEKSNVGSEVVEVVVTGGTSELVTALAKRVMSGVNCEDFCKAWNKAESLQAFCDQTGISSANASQRAANYRKMGINLKKWMGGGGGRKINVNTINELLAESEKVEVQS